MYCNYLAIGVELYCIAQGHEFYLLYITNIIITKTVGHSNFVIITTIT